MELYLVDISSFIFRAFYAIRALSNSKGIPTNAVYGVATMLQRLIEERGPSHMAVLYDSKEPSFRKTTYKEYKANRSAPPDDLIPQFDMVEKLVKEMGIHSYRRAGIEADDLIATVAKQWRKRHPKSKVFIVTGDKDLMQLVDEQIQVLDTMNNKFYDVAGVTEKFGVSPVQIRDYLALIGDSSDNIPGVPSIGPKSAVTLIQEYGTMEGILQAARDGKISGKKGEVLKEHVKAAELSYDLVTLKEDVDLHLEDKDFEYQFSLSDGLTEFLKECEFNTLITKWAGLACAPASVADQKLAVDLTQSKLGKFTTVDTEEAFKKVLEKIEKTKQFGFDLETTSLSPHDAEIVGIALAMDSDEGFYIPVGHMTGKQLDRANVISRLKPYLENPKYKKIGQNLKYDFSVLIAQGLNPEGIGADTMIADYILDPASRHNLAALCLKYLDYEVVKYDDVAGKGKEQISFADVPIDVATRYSGEDALAAWKLWEVMEKKLNEEKLMRVFAEIELPLVKVLARMETFGVHVNAKYLNGLSKEFEKEIAEIELKIQKYTKGPVNLNSPKQLGVLLFEELKLPTQGKTKTGFSTDASVLEALAPLHEVPKLLLEYREISKLKGTYVDPIPEMINQKTGKLHASFQQTVAATGRLSSSDPNLQNIPIRSQRGRLIRQAFVPSKGSKLLAVDYSQIELRLLAHMSGDKDLCHSFQINEDVHRRTASEIYHVALDQVTDEQRSVAKAVNFGLMYGKTAFGLSQELGIPRGEAKSIIDKYFERYSGVKKYLDGLITTAKELGYAETELGRKRPLPEIHSSNSAIRANAERMAMNSPIQGTAADLMKLAMIAIDEELESKGFKTRLAIQVHDEVVLDCPEEELKAVQKIVEDCMIHAMKFRVPLQVNSGVGDNWMVI
ncbi:MAG: DNA polymerase I [Xanthomonadaceae bacterium]|nr:DNA polymerase I [Xanthomonadaceae bacterium]